MTEKYFVYDGCGDCIAIETDVNKAHLICQENNTDGFVEYRPEYKIYNGTPHAINIVKGATKDPKIRKYVGGEVILSIPSDGMLNADIATYPGSFINGIPTFEKRAKGVDPLPEGYDIYLVSALYASAAAKNGIDMSKIYTVSDPVYTPDGNSFIGCLGICAY